ncbi:hypothetical protein DOTSEDRAFT_33883 [Dothistroma septosporum NZE10]|uniref:DUF1989 domain-containing protein n=1 Tax=Dothistroma septosporum (strain NZE10 / CBS 128990) TaxID=675120 RepID=N1PSL9_DOTSN|nr:hypothetical protein DOTSEDRAFT_33883 [Dothistroma septosporum NZE10]
MTELQTIPARHGVATFVPAGQVIKIVNTSGTQVVDTWAFALPKPDGTKDEQEAKLKEEESRDQANLKAASKTEGQDLPSQEEAEKTTAGAQADDKGESNETPKKSTWSSYVPSLGLGGKKKDDSQDRGKEKDSGRKDDMEQQKNSKTWGSYFSAGKGFSSYVPKQATDTVSQFASSHQRDTSKSYLEQLQDFSKTPVGAAGMKGMAVMTGSGYAGSLYAGYQAWNMRAGAAPNMEFMSMAHTRTATLHLRPKVNDTLVTNMREPILTVIEDTSSGIHDTLIPACDPCRYQALGVPKWEEHGSCAENLVLALKELNERAGLKGAKAVGADVTINQCPAPLNLFMNIPWDDEGDIGFHPPKAKKGDYVRFKAERDVVVVMSACPNDVNGINGKSITDASFVVEDGEDTTSAIKRAVPKKKAPVSRNAPAKKTPVATNGDDEESRPSTSAPVPAAKKSVTQKKAAPATNGASTGPKSAAKAAQPVKKAAPAGKPLGKTTGPPPSKPPPAKKAVPQSTATSTTNDEPAPIKKKPKKLVRPTQAGAS